MLREARVGPDVVFTGDGGSLEPYDQRWTISPVPPYGPPGWLEGSAFADERRWVAWRWTRSGSCWTRNWETRGRELMVSHGVVATITGSPAAILAVLTFHSSRQARRRAADGLCRHCGYDLRASLQR